MNALEIKNVTLTANVVTTITSTRDIGEYAVTHLGNTSEPLYVRQDGTNPAVHTDGAKPVLPGQTVWFERRKSDTSGDGTSVKIISASAAKVSVEFP